MLLLHQVHRVRGAKEDAFDDAYRDEYLPALAKSDGSRLLWYLRLAHGSGQAYTVVTITGCRDAAAWAELAERVRAGDLAAWSAKVDAMRHACDAKVVQPVPWSPLQDDRPGHGARGRRDAQELAVHGGHGLALRRRAPGLPRQGGHPLRPHAEQPEGGGHRHHRARGRLPARLRDPPDDRGDPLAARGEPQGASCGCWPTTSRRRPRPRERGCTTPWRCATAGRAGCCAARRGPRSFEEATRVTERFDLTAVLRAPRARSGRGRAARLRVDARDTSAAYQERFAGDGDEGRLVCVIPQEATWDSWERHPAGEEVVVLLSGRVDLVQELDGQNTSSRSGRARRSSTRRTCGTPRGCTSPGPLCSSRPARDRGATGRPEVERRAAAPAPVLPRNETAIATPVGEHSP